MADAVVVSLSLHPGPSVGFEEPFEMLQACHERVQRMLALLRRLCAHLGEVGPDERAAQAARDVMRYFDRAAVAHHEDEERHVLPRLRAHGLDALADRLHADHQRMAAAWAVVRVDLLRVAAVPGARRLPVPGFESRWAAFAGLYDEHIDLEESLAYPEARRHCGPCDLDTMGREMSARRGLPST
jgi:hemerythrin-like domain-containing protein